MFRNLGLHSPLVLFIFYRDHTMYHFLLAFDDEASQPLKDLEELSGVLNIINIGDMISDLGCFDAGATGYTGYGFRNRIFCQSIGRPKLGTTTDERLPSGP